MQFRWTGMGLLCKILPFFFSLSLPCPALFQVHGHLADIPSARFRLYMRLGHSTNDVRPFLSHSWSGADWSDNRGTIHNSRTRQDLRPYPGRPPLAIGGLRDRTAITSNRAPGHSVCNQANVKALFAEQPPKCLYKHILAISRLSVTFYAYKGLKI